MPSASWDSKQLTIRLCVCVLGGVILEKNHITVTTGRSIVMAPLLRRRRYGTLREKNAVQTMCQYVRNATLWYCV